MASLSRVMNQFNKIILGQDIRVVRSQPQAPTHELKDERLVQSDLAIALFRKELRRRLKVVSA